MSEEERKRLPVPQRVPETMDLGGGGGGGFDPYSPESLADSCSTCPIPLVSLSSSSVNLTTLVTSTQGKPLPTAKMMLS